MKKKDTDGGMIKRIGKGKSENIVHYLTNMASEDLPKREGLP